MQVGTLVGVHMAYVANGTLLSELHADANQLGIRPVEKAIIVWRQIVEAVNYLHTAMNVAHRDLKLENCMLDACGGWTEWCQSIAHLQATSNWSTSRSCTTAAR